MQTQKFFFSYSRVNTDFVVRLANDLKNAGANVWLDQIDIKPGANWDEAIQNALNEASGVLLVLSPSSVASKNVLDEASYALDRGKRILPLLIEDCVTPFRLARKQHISFLAGYDAGLEQLLKTLASDEDASQEGSAGTSKIKTGGKSWKQNLWSSASMKIGIVAAVLGILLSSAAAFKLLSPDDNARADKTEASLRMKELEPKLEMSYVSLDQHIYFTSENDSAAKNKSLLFLDYPLLKNEVAFDDKENGGVTPGEVFIEDGYNRINYLIIQNKGKATPDDVRVIMKRYTISEAVNIEESPGEASPVYETKVREKKKDSTIRVFSPPTSLETGKGLLIPLFVSRQSENANPGGKRSWSIVSRVVYIPDRVEYTDPLDGKKKTITVRTMRDPVMIANGVEGRG